MKAALCLSFCVVLAAAVKITPDTVERVIFADTLRGKKSPITSIHSFDSSILIECVS